MKEPLPRIKTLLSTTKNTFILPLKFWHQPTVSHIPEYLRYKSFALTRLISLGPLFYVNPVKKTVSPENTFMIFNQTI